MYIKKSCRYLKNGLSRLDNSKTILRCLENVLFRLGLHFKCNSIEARVVNTDIVDESYSNRGTAAFLFFVGVINHVLAIAIFSMNDTRKSNLSIIIFLNLFDHTYKLFRFLLLYLVDQHYLIFKYCFVTASIYIFVKKIRRSAFTLAALNITFIKIANDCNKPQLINNVVFQ